MLRKVIRFIIIGLLLLLSAAGLLIPDRYWPAGWVPYREYEGKFAGRPVVLAPPSIRRATVPIDYEIEMTSGMCQIARIDRSEKVIPIAGIGRATGTTTLPAGEQLRLDPGAGMGHYAVGIGLRWYPLAPLFRRCLAGGMLFGLVAVFLIRWRKPAWRMALKSLFTPWQWAALTMLAVLSGAFLYGALHELGHALAALALGGRVDGVVFTILGGETPHVNFGYLPEKAGPWMLAGGVFLPILVAYGLLIVWLTLGRRLSRFGQTLLLTPVVLLLFASFGSPFDDHLRGMALCLGFNRPAGILLVKSIPVGLTLVAYAVVGWRLWRQKQWSGAACSGDKESPDRLR